MKYFGKVSDRKSGEPLSGIRVSDGRNTAYTNEEGRYELPGWERERVINVGVLTKRHGDWFAYTGGVGGEYDFIIDRAEASSDFSFFHTSDTEIEGRNFADWVTFMREKVTEHGASFFIHTGDLCREDGVKRHLFAMNRETVGCPVRYAIGNHDFIGYSYGEEMFERLYGPTWYSFDCGDIHFVTLSIGYGDNQSGYERCDQWEWLKNDLELVGNEKKIIIFDHTYCVGDENGFSPVVGDISFDLRSKGLLAWVFGHYHYNFLNDTDGIYNICTARPDSGGIDSSPAGIRKISVSGHELSSQMIYNMPKSYEPCDECVRSTQLSGQIEFSNIIEVSGDILAASSDDGFPKECAVYRINGNSGDIVWKYSTENSVKGDVAYDGGKVYAQDSIGNLYCIDFDSGSLLWKVHSDIKEVVFTRTGVIIVGDYVITGCPSYVFCYDKKNGSPVWENHISNGGKSPARFVYDEKRRQIIVSIQWQFICALDIETGELKWKNGENPIRYRTATPAVFDDIIYTCGMSKVAKVDAESGEALLMSGSESRIDVSGAPVISDGIVYYPTGDHGVIGFDLDSLEIKLRFPTENARLFTAPYIHGNIQTVEGTPVIFGDELIFSASDGYVYIYDKNSAELKKKINIGCPSCVTPIVTDKYIITADFCGEIKKFKR